MICNNCNKEIESNNYLKLLDRPGVICIECYKKKKGIDYEQIFNKNFLKTNDKELQLNKLDKESDNPSPVKIDIDLIRSLKKEGKYPQAEKLLKAYYRDIAKMKNNLKNELIRKDIKIKKHLGICCTLRCNNKTYLNHATCEYHYKKRKELRGKDK